MCCSWCIVLKALSSLSKSVNFPVGSQACCKTVSNSMPKKVMQLVGCTTFSGFNEACSAWQSMSMSEIAVLQAWELADPAKKNHPDSGMNLGPGNGNGVSIVWCL